jgi:hypothetical protein
MTSFRWWLADRLIRAAYRLDPYRARVLRRPNGSYAVTVGGVELTRITPEMVTDHRTGQEWQHAAAEHTRTL